MAVRAAWPSAPGTEAWADRREETSAVHRDGQRRWFMGSVVFESLERRTHFSVTAVFVPFAGVLDVFGDSANNSIVVSRDAAGNILVNGGAVKVLGGTP